MQQQKPRGHSVVQGGPGPENPIRYKWGEQEI